MPKHRKANGSGQFDPVSESLSPDQFYSGNFPQVDDDGDDDTEELFHFVCF
jgi:hypothetical protein